jgi:hypothetical protein
VPGGVWGVIDSAVVLGLVTPAARTPAPAAARAAATAADNVAPAVDNLTG